MSVAEYSVTITRWMLLRVLLRLLPGAWLRACRETGVSPLHPCAIWLLLRAFVVVAKSGG